MEGIISQMMEYFGMTTIPTSFSEFMYMFLGLCFGIRFVEFVVYTTFGFVKNMSEVTRR